MASSGKLDWRGCEDGTPPSSTKNTNLRDVSDNKSAGTGDSWKGMEDGTPSSKPTAPNK